MTPFELSNVVVLPFWALMILAPLWSVTRRLIGSPWIVAPPALIYLATLVPVASIVLPAVVNPVPAEIAALLGTPTGTALAWAHFVAFDLFVGRWIYCDSRSRLYSPWWVSPVLVLTLLVGPVGLLLYLSVRSIVGGGNVAADPA
ncbi:hypothetical protein TBR22_A45640 [Luteitalea sp. TBR-22]|uniref:ABA4-like family protein n=1 Tax=Luteitalea sp. TBR-22 TaxID=2802971 RepID=UPI001AF18435|nr:ABA4-like family protein [Luteitalea sp. TBR-22]BCS35337.1 hypothetical protein TBR22_A45640 [Luteitalea sp. TBR-22]